MVERILQKILIKLTIKVIKLSEYDLPKKNKSEQLMLYMVYSTKERENMFLWIIKMLFTWLNGYFKRNKFKLTIKVIKFSEYGFSKKKKKDRAAIN